MNIKQKIRYKLKEAFILEKEIGISGVFGASSFANRLKQKSRKKRKEQTKIPKTDTKPPYLRSRKYKLK